VSAVLGGRGSCLVEACVNCSATWQVGDCAVLGFKGAA
jgi:hypothetical protein